MVGGMRGIRPLYPSIGSAWQPHTLHGGFIFFQERWLEGLSRTLQFAWARVRSEPVSPRQLVQPQHVRVPGMHVETYSSHRTGNQHLLTTGSPLLPICTLAAHVRV